MKGSNHFKNTIKAYLDQRAETDILFSFQYSKPEKSIDDCVTYILNEVKKSGCSGFHDDEIFNMAVHFYDEDTIEIGESMNNAHVVVNQFVELTEEEKMQAMKSYAADCGFDLSQEICLYLLRHGRRDLPSLMMTLDALDRYSLANQRQITIPLLRELLQVAS